MTSIKIPDSVTSIGNYAFNKCSGLTSIKIPNSITAIGGGTFSGCSSLTSIELPYSVTSIGDYTFYGCSSLASIVIPNTVKSIGNNSFSKCNSLIEMTVLGTTPPTVGNDELDSQNTIYGATLFVPEGSVELYKSTEPWSRFANIMSISAFDSAIVVEAADADATADYYDLRGVRVSGDALASGVYIKRQGGQATKVLVK